MTHSSLYFEESNWSENAAHVIQNAINCLLLTQDRCSVMLTGGKSARLLYQAWSENKDFKQLNNVDFYFSDERSVLPLDSESNYGMVMENLFKYKIPGNCSIYRMEAENLSHKDAINKYESILPDRIDILLLSLGDDGHIASLFAIDATLKHSNRMVTSVMAPIPPKRRLSITPKLIQSARQIYILAIGPIKRRVYNEIVNENPKPSDTPGVLAFGGIWILNPQL
jgi:6-phosphogluconolactonase